MNVLLSCCGPMHWRQLRLLFGQPTSCGLCLDSFVIFSSIVTSIYCYGYSSLFITHTLFFTLNYILHCNPIIICNFKQLPQMVYRICIEVGKVYLNLKLIMYVYIMSIII